jgi:hypothetical protein
MSTFKQIVFVVFTALCLASICVFADDTAMPAAKDASAPAAAEAVPDSSIEISKMALCMNVQDRECDQEVTTAKVGDTLVGWTQVRSGLGEVTITHRWLHEADNMGDVPLAVKSSPWRTWSRKTVAEPGNWTLQVLNSSGAVLKEVHFTVSAQ